MQMQNKPSEEKINQWSEFINQYLYDYDFINFMNAGVYSSNEFKFAYRDKGKRKKCLLNMFDDLDIFGNSRQIESIFYLTDIAEIKNFNEYMNFKGDENSPDYQAMESRAYSLRDENPEKSNKFAKMTNREYLKWRLKVIKDGHGQHMPEESISLKATIGLAFLSLIGMYWFFTPKTKLSIKILMGILNLFVVPAFVCAIVFDLSLYFLIPAAVVYGLLVLASCMHFGLNRFYNHAKNQDLLINTNDQEFINTYDEIMDYLNYETLPESIIDNKDKEIVNERENQNEDIDKLINDCLN